MVSDHIHDSPNPLPKSHLQMPPSELGVWKGASTPGETHLQCWRTKLGLYISQMVEKMRKGTLVALKSEVM